MVFTCELHKFTTKIYKMNKTINLTKEQAIKFYNSSTDQGFKDLLETNFGKDFYKQDITDIVYDLNSLENYINNSTKETFRLPYNINTTNKLEKTLNAVYILSKIAEIYNEGTILDWENNNQYKYLPYQNFSGVSWVVFPSVVWSSGLGAAGCLYYKNSELSEKSYNNFKQYWEDYWGN